MMCGDALCNRSPMHVQNTYKDVVLDELEVFCIDDLYVIFHTGAPLVIIGLIRVLYSASLGSTYCVLLIFTITIIQHIFYC